MSRIAVLSHMVTDEVFGPAGELELTQVGGAGAYAALGASLCAAPDEAVLVCGVGTADRGAMTRWLAARQIDPGGLFDAGEHSPVTEVRYRADGERTETSRYGDAHFRAAAPYPRQIPEGPLDGVYLFRDLEPEFWAELPRLRERCAGPILWELHNGVCRPEERRHVLERAATVDVLSLNESEARALMGGDDAEAFLAEVPARLVVALRRGARGSTIVHGGTAWHLGVAPTPALDPTGGGNSWSGAFVAALAAGLPVPDAGRLATAVAARVVAHPGAPLVDDAARAEVRRLAPDVHCAATTRP